MKRVILLVLALGMLRLPALALEVPGKSAVLMEARTGTVLYEANADQALPPASVTKIMTMLLIMEAVDSGAVGLGDIVTVSEAAAEKGGSQVYLKAGEQMPVSDLLKSIAVSSANDAACAMAEHIAGSEGAFVEKMNGRARDLGMTATNFVNCTGLDDSPEAAEHRTSARDIALMSRELLTKHPDITKFTTIWMDSIRGGSFGLSNTNKLIRFYPGATGLKTGFTTGARYCLSASAQREGMHLIAVILGAESAASRNAGCKALLDYGFAGWWVYDPPAEEVGSVPTTLGRQQTVAVVPAQTGGILLEKQHKNQAAAHIDLPQAVTAPVHKGQRLGTMTVRVGEQEVKQIPLVAAEAVERLTWAELTGRVLRRVCMGGDGAGVHK